MDYLEDIFDLVKRNLVAVLSVIFGIAAVVASLVYVNVRLSDVNDCPECVCETLDEENNREEEKNANTLTVDVKGAVKKPGVYEMAVGSKIQDAIVLAGGLAKNGSTVNINLSRKLTDEMVIYVFTKDELKKKEVTNEVVCEIPKCECETVTVTECPSVNGNDKETNKDKTDRNETPSLTKKVSLNKASLEELLTLDGIGEAKAKTIIEYREKNGSFEKIEDIQKVNGIGSVLYEKIKDQLTL